MIQYLTLGQVLFLHQRLIEQFGGTSGIHDQNALESALAQPKMTFEGKVCCRKSCSALLFLN